MAAKSSTEDVLKFYALYKQSVVGSCNIPKPSIFYIKERQKWDAWNALGSMAKEDAMKLYTDKLDELSPDWGDKEEYSNIKTGWVSVSKMLPEDDSIKEHEKSLFHFIQENNLAKVREFTQESLFAVDDNKMTALHWACDRGYVDIIHYLMEKQLDVDKQDIDGQTPLHFASSCGHESAVKVLLDNGAKVDISDSDGCLPIDVAENYQIKQLFQ